MNLEEKLEHRVKVKQEITELKANPSTTMEVLQKKRKELRKLTNAIEQDKLRYKRKKV